jgi:hypothetical protein
MNVRQSTTLLLLLDFLLFFFSLPFFSSSFFSSRDSPHAGCTEGASPSDRQGVGDSLLSVGACVNAKLLNPEGRGESEGGRLRRRSEPWRTRAS